MSNNPYQDGPDGKVGEWDYHFCRCENNGDHCDYCQMFDWTTHLEPPYTRCTLKEEHCQ